MKLTDKRHPRGSGTFSKAARAVWVRLPWHQVTVSVPKSNDSYEHVLFVLTRGQSSVTIDLSRLTSEELAAFKFAVLVATEVAEPIVKALDEKARNSHEHGDDSDDRVYRGLPTVVVRRGTLPLGAHSESVLQRHKDVLQGIGGQLLSGRRPSENGGAVDEAVGGEDPSDGEEDVASLDSEAQG